MPLKFINLQNYCLLSLKIIIPEYILGMSL
nr:MAG TPA: hypothetical protein [Caudoviricetes sp.]